MDKKWYLIGAIALVLVLSFIWNKDNQPSQETLPVEEIITREDGTTVKQIGDLVEPISAEELAQKQTEINQKLENTEAVNLLAEENQAGTGKSYRIFEGDTYYQKIMLEGMTPLEKGYFYQDWLEKADGTALSIGRVEMNGSSGVLYYSAKEDRSDYIFTTVTKEIDDNNPQMSEVILRGSYLN